MDRSVARVVELVLGALLAVGLAAPGAPDARAAAGRPGATAAIVGGRTADAGTFGSLAFVTSQVTDTSAMACTGTVIAPAVVLTAAHCLLDDQARAPRSAAGVTVTTGRTDRSAADAGQVLTAARVIVHPAYDAQAITADAALILLSSTTTAPPLPVVSSADGGLAAPGAVAAIAGWGLSDAAAPSASPLLQTATTTILGDSACRRLLGPTFDAGATICAVDSPGFAAATCRGDSGGPLIVQRPDGTPVLAGVVSWGSQSCDARVPQAFTRLSAYAGWIASQVAAAPTPATTLPAGGGAPEPPASRRPQGGRATAGPVPAHAGWYRGRTGQRRGIAVLVAAGGRTVATVRVSLAARCVRGGRARTVVRGVVVDLPPALGALSGARRFAVQRTAAHRVRVRVAGRFTAGDAGALTGTLYGSWRAGGAVCTTGPVGFRAAR